MNLDESLGSSQLENFLKVWPLERLSTMSIKEYVDLDNHETFCYMLEKGTVALGQIAGQTTSSKFGIWRFRRNKDFDPQYKKNFEYVWDVKYGDNQKDAFLTIRNYIIQLAVAAAEKDFEKVSKVPIHSFVKWKIAFIYSRKQVLPIYEKHALLKIANNLGGKFKESSSTLSLQLFLINKKPLNTDMLDYSSRLWEQHIEGVAIRNYFVIGSKYKDEENRDSKDVFPEMLQHNIVAIGFLYQTDLTEFYCEANENIDEVVKEKANNEDAEIAKVQGYFRRFLNLKPGDIIALKNKWQPGYIEICAYAIVVERNGKVYEYNPEILGHQINVEFVETEIKRTVGVNLRGSIHQIPTDKPELLNKIFGSFMIVDKLLLDDSESKTESNVIKRKNEQPYMRGPVASQVVLQIHSIMQNRFLDLLINKFPTHEIRLEEGQRIDIIRESVQERWLYEIKPYESVSLCLREATGQLLEYAYRFPDYARATYLVIVGRGDLTGESSGFIDHFQQNVILPLEYEQFLLE